MEASQHVYVVKVRALPDPALLFPSERRYSALTVGGLAAGHALLGGVSLLLGALALSWDPPQGTWFGHLGAGLWLGVAALQASLCGVLAWRRWYEDRYIVWFFRSSVLAALVAGTGLVLTSAALVHLHENVLSLQPEMYAHDHGNAGVSVVADEGSGGGPSWLDLAFSDGNSSTISSGGVFSDLVRDQDHDLVAADSTHHEELTASRAAAGATDQEQPVPESLTGEPEWSVLRWVPVPLPPRASAQIRSLVAANVMVACFLELLWSLLGARLAWRGMQSADVDISPHVSGAPVGVAHGVAPRPSMAVPTDAATLERGAADGKVDVSHSADLSDGDVKKVDKASEDSRRKNKKRYQQTKSAASINVDHACQQRRRRAPAPGAPDPHPQPDLPELPQLHLPPEQRTMNLEERMARLLGAERTEPTETVDSSDSQPSP